MKPLVLTAAIAVAVLFGIGATTRAGETKTIAEAELRNRVRGAWAGKMIGVAEGAPTEFRYCGVLVPEDKMPAWKPEMIREAPRQDDLYVQMSFAAVVDAKGLD